MTDKPVNMVRNKDTEYISIANINNNVNNMSIRKQENEQQQLILGSKTKYNGMKCFVARQHCTKFESANDNLKEAKRRIVIQT